MFSKIGLKIDTILYFLFELLATIEYDLNQNKIYAIRMYIIQMFKILIWNFGSKNSRNFTRGEVASEF